MTNLPLENAFNLEVTAKQIISIEAPEDIFRLHDLQSGSYLVLGSATNMIMGRSMTAPLLKYL